MFATLPPVPVHPHLPKAIVVGGAAGKTTLLYFTVPYNPEHLKDLQPGFQWHLGFAQLETEVPLQVGSTTVASGKYKCDVRRGDSGDQWSLVLTNSEFANANFAWQRAKAGLSRGRSTEEDVEAAEAALDAVQKKIDAGEMIKEYVVPLQAKKGDASEHLTLSVINRGYATVQRGSDVAVGGVEFSLRIDFGDIHEELELAEVFDKDAKKRP
jgi:hypothetical protein